MPQDDTVRGIAERVRSGEIQATSVAESALATIAAKNGALNAFLAVPHEDVLRQARAIDEKRARGETLGPLAGVPIGI